MKRVGNYNFNKRYKIELEEASKRFFSFNNLMEYTEPYYSIQQLYDTPPEADFYITGIELIKRAFLLGIEDQEQQYYNKISMKIWRQSEKIQSPKMIAKMIEINKNILAPDLCKIVEKGIKDGSVDTKYPMEISEQILLQINIGLLLAISDITEKELTGKIEFISEWTKENYW